MEREFVFDIDKIRFHAKFCRDTLTGLYIVTLGTPLAGEDNSTIDNLKDFLKRYINGEKVIYTGPIELSGTEKEKEVLRKCMEINYGEVKNYEELAEAAGIMRGSRFAGNVMAKNKIIIIIPCHRIVRKDGTIGNYGPGKEYKKHFLKIEGREYNA